MRPTVFGTGLAILGLLMAFAFTNCAGQNEGSLFANYASSCVGPDCTVAEKQTLLDIRVNRPETFWVYPWAEAVNIGGDCNEGGYEKSRVEWRLSVSGVPLINSEARYAVTLNDSYRAECKNGRFTLLVDLMDANQGLITGLNSGGGATQHTLEVEIFGIEVDEEGREVPVPNPVLSPEYVPLVPICAASQSC